MKFYMQPPHVISRLFFLCRVAILSQAQWWWFTLSNGEENMQKLV